MQRTDNFNLIVVEGSDTVNLLTQMNPNTQVIDEQMFKNQNAGVQTATELLSGTVHAITRSIPDASMIRFTAVSRFTAGDTFTVDGVQVSALLPSGEQLPDGAFIIGSEVLCVLKGTLLTVFASGGAVALAKDAEKLGGQLPAYYATKTEVDNAQNTANSAGALAENNRQLIAEFKPVLLWSNDRVQNTFNEQTITIQNLNEYSYIDIQIGNKNPNGTLDKGIGSINRYLVSNDIPCDLYSFDWTSSQYMDCRRFTIYSSNNTIKFMDGYRNGTINNDLAVPYRIWGIK